MSKINIEYQPELQVWSQDLDKKYTSAIFSVWGDTPTIEETTEI